MTRNVRIEDALSSAKSNAWKCNLCILVYEMKYVY